MTFGTASGSPEMLRTLPCLAGGDELVAAIRVDLAASGSVLELMKRYVEELRGVADNDAPPYRKLRRLFELGAAPEQIEGHHYGVTLGLRTGDLRGPAAQFGNVLGYLWGESVGRVCPWVGKSFAALEPTEVDRLSGGAIPRDGPVAAGINHFHAIEGAPLNAAANAVLELIWPLEQPPATEAARFGHQRDGGHFLAHRAPSVHPSSPRTVYRLNYRFPALENPAPLPALIDEVVEIAPGLYLGQLLFATHRLLEPYDPAEPDARYAYQHFGYFLIFAESWNEEARRVFRNLGIPESSAALAAAILSLGDAQPPGVQPAVWQAVRADVAGSPTLMHLLKSYSDALRSDPSTDAAEFAKLEALFLAGTAPRTMSGFFRGASVTFQSQGLLAAFDVNKLNLAWRVARHLSPWTGKRFDPIEPGRLAELTDGYEVPAEGTTFGSNTVVFRSAGEKLTRAAMTAVGMWIIDATEDERRRDGYDARTFFFIGKPARSIVPESRGKDVYQFNYRWKPLRSPPPDNLCIDEIVAIADGLYLGKLLYATNVLRSWTPRTDTSEYAYRLFGYFLLMNERWQALRVQLGFDLDNT
jgi:hypothetical protein